MTRWRTFLSGNEKTVMKYSRVRDTRRSRRISFLLSGFTVAGDDLTKQEDRPALAIQGNSETESNSKAQWTDERHSLYLKSVEASFVNQLNNDQFKVLRGGRRQRINFVRSLDLELNRMNEFDDFVANPWIQRYKSACNHVNAASTSEEIESVENSALSCSSTSSKQQHCQIPMCDEYVLCSNAEVSDQNFVDDDGIGKERGNTKKTRISMPDMVNKEHDRNDKSFFSRAYNCRDRICGHFCQSS